MIFLSPFKKGRVGEGFFKTIGKKDATSWNEVRPFLFGLVFFSSTPVAPDPLPLSFVYCATVSALPQIPTS